MLVATVSQILLAKYGTPLMPNLHVHCICHVINLVVQAILAAIRDAPDPDNVDHYLLNKEQPFHLDIEVDPDQVALDNEEFEDDEDEVVEPEYIILEEEEKVKVTKGPLSKVCLHICRNELSC